jgi:hypothetical protein
MAPRASPASIVNLRISVDCTPFRHERTLTVNDSNAITRIARIAQGNGDPCRLLSQDLRQIMMLTIGATTHNNAAMINNKGETGPPSWTISRNG